MGPSSIRRKTTSDRMEWRNAMCDNRLRALYLKEWMAEVRATLGEWWRQGDSAASIAGFQSALEVREREDAASAVENTP